MQEIKHVQNSFLFLLNQASIKLNKTKKQQILAKIKLQIPKIFIKIKPSFIYHINIQ